MTFSKMKDSGLPWIGKIPNHWTIERGKNILTLLERPVLPDDGVITCFRDGEVTLRSNRREDGFTFSDLEIGYQGIEPGDLVVHGMDGFAGSIGISDSRGKATPVLNVLDSIQDKKYLMYFLRCMAYNGVFLALSTGIRVRSCDTNWNKIKNVLFTLPPIEEQKLISSFIESSLSNADNLISQHRKTIDEYVLLKQSVITEISCSGVKKHQRTKQVNIDYLDSIPFDWNVSKIKFETDCNLKSLEENTPPSFEFDYIDIGSVEYGQGIIHTERYQYSNAPSRARRIVQKGDVIISTVRTYLKAMAIIKDFDFPIIVSTGFAVLACHNSLLSGYLYYYAQSIPFVEYVKNHSCGVGYPSINTSELISAGIPLPSLEEQLEITNYLDSYCQKIDASISERQKAILELEAYKKSILFEYVTGKKQIEQ